MQLHVRRALGVAEIGTSAARHALFTSGIAFVVCPAVVLGFEERNQ
jgi:hypothetical protein